MQLWKLLNSPCEAVAFESGAGAQTDAKSALTGPVFKKG